jgi:hypothetical protein
MLNLIHVQQFKKFMNSNITLRNFWSNSSIGHENIFHEDFTKMFLLTIVENLNLPSNVYIDSNFKKKFIFKKISDKFKTINNLEARQRIAYGYDYELFKKRDSKYIWYTPENMRPPLHLNYDVFLSHDLESYGGKNIYLPFWVTRLSKTLTGAIDFQSNLLNKRNIQSRPRKFACAVISNPDPIRLEFIKLLSNYGKVDIFGKLGTPIDDKMKVLEQYRFNICFENSLFPGYVTEKSLESWLSGCIPVWHGLDAGEFLNRKALINVAELGFQNSIEEIVKLDSEDSDYYSVANEPFLKKEFDFKSFSSSLLNLMK